MKLEQLDDHAEDNFKEGRERFENGEIGHLSAPVQPDMSSRRSKRSPAEHEMDGHVEGRRQPKKQRSNKKQGIFENEWVGIVGERVFLLRQTEDTVEYK